MVAVETAPFWDSDLNETRERVQALWPKADAALAEEIKKHPNQIRDGEAWKDKFIAYNLPPEIAKRMNGVSNFGFHYLGAAKIMAPIGKAFAKAMVNVATTYNGHDGQDLLHRQPALVDHVRPVPVLEILSDVFDKVVVGFETPAQR